jgi:hypothetical protein
MRTLEVVNVRQLHLCLSVALSLQEMEVEPIDACLLASPSAGMRVLVNHTVSRGTRNLHRVPPWCYGRQFL